MALMYFYQGHRLTLLHQEQEQRRVFDVAEHAHAVVIKSADAQTSILLANDALSPATQSHPKQPVEFRLYAPYGYQAPHPLLPGFTGQVPESLTEGYLLGKGYRLYNPVLMRFTAPDDWSPFGAAGMNTYAYCKGDPVNHRDPSGHMLKALKGMLRNAGERVLKATDSIMYEYVKAKHGKRIFDEIYPIESSAGKPMPHTALTPAERKVGKMMLNESLEYHKNDYALLTKRHSKAVQGKEGSKIIFDESPEYIADVLSVDIERVRVRIANTEKALLAVNESAQAIRGSR